MKNQLRKATLRAAALTMSATIAATSVPMTAFAHDKPLADEPEKAPEESTAKSAEAQVADKEKTTTGDLATANKEVGDIKPAAQSVGIATGKGSDVDMAETNVAKAVENEKTVAADVKTIVDSKEAEDGINASEYAIEELISKKKDIVETENKNQEEINKEIAAAEEAINNKANKEEAKSIVEDANEKITSGNESYTKAENGIAELDKDYEKEMSNLETKQKAYSDAVSNGVKDIEKVEGDIANAKTNVSNLQTQVDNLTTEVNNMSTEVKKSAVEELADKYNDARRTSEGTKELFETIVKSYQEDILGKGATVEEIGSYNDEYKAYPVTYKIGDNVETIYLSYTTNDNDNGITINEVTKREVVDKEGYDAYYKHGNDKYSVEAYEELVENGKVIEQKEKNGKITSYYIENVKLTDFYKEGTVTDNNGKEITTTISNKRTVVTNNGAVQVYGDVETITKTTTSLDTTKPTEYKTFADAEAGKVAVIKQYEDAGYENVSVEITSDSKEDKWEETAVFFDRQTDTKEGVNIFKSYEKGDLIDDRTKYIISNPNCKENYKHGLIFNHHVSNDWTFEYVAVENEEKDCETIKGLWGYVEELFTGINTPKISIENAVKSEIELKNGYGFAVDYKVINGDTGTATVYYIKGDKKTGTGNTKEAARADLVAKCGELDLTNADYNSKPELVQKANIKYRISATKTSTLTVEQPNIPVAGSGNDKASKLMYHEGQETTYKNVFDSEKAYDNSFLDTAKNDKTKRLEEEEKLSNEKTAKQRTLGELNTQLTEASKALEKAETDSAELKKQVDALNTTASTIGANIKLLKENYTNLKLDSNGTEGRKQKIEDAYNKLPNRPSNNGGSNNGGGSSNNNNNNNNNQPAVPVLPVGPAATTTTTTTTQQVVTLVDDQTPLSATADDTVAPKTNKKAAKKNATKTTDSDSKKANKKAAKKQPKKVTPEVEDDTMDEDLEIVSLDDNDQVPLAPGVADTKTDDIIDETSSVSWLWLIILVCASVVTFGTYKGVKKHNENKGKNNR